MQSRDERVAAAAARETATSERILNTENARSVEAVNNFWFESDALGENGRTSLVVYPRNGRFPDVVPGTRVQRSDANGVTVIPGDRPVRYTHGGINSDGPEAMDLRIEAFLSGASSLIPDHPYSATPIITICRFSKTATMSSS